MAHWVSYFFLRIIVELFRFIPFRVLYALSDALAFLFFNIIGYRKKVVFDNLRRSFPEKSDAEIKRIARLFYRNLTDITLETIKSYTVSVAKIKRRCVCQNPTLLNDYFDRGQSIILTGSHYNNWEWAGLAMPGDLNGDLHGVYKPLTNKVIDGFTNRNRSRGKLVMTAMDEAYSTLLKLRQEPTAYMLIADQSPGNRKSAHWVEFFGQNSASLPGVDVLARKFNYPVIYYDMQRVRRGFYEITYSILWENPSEATERDITRAYARHLEAIIREKPENWLWSHKRWKIQREG